ncbi:hypothetical protein [Glaciibacter flavus]|uniref:hypothetical protein n=1 Tax=Orlajensenia flava TaxID=2565934 RepID=UPI003AFFCAA0
MDACSQLAETASDLSRTTASPRRFLLELGERVGGVRRGVFWATDAASGGSNRLRGRGFRPVVDDDTDGQARHFAGIVAVAARLGPGLTRWLSIHVGRDAPESADGRLTDLAVGFVARIRSGQLVPADAAEWIRGNLCSR